MMNCPEQQGVRELLSRFLQWGLGGARQQLLAPVLSPSGSEKPPSSLPLLAKRVGCQTPLSTDPLRKRRMDSNPPLLRHAVSAHEAPLESSHGGGLFKSPSLRSSTWGAQGTRDAGRIMDPGGPGAQLCCSSCFVGLSSMAQYI